ncbi:MULTISPECIES: membrane protein insertase YidC [Holospora]|uniref:Membrane protein insertase YidC n=2 Tax=Holospora TaxID=44747 RepID=A0A061JIZ7_9PROT|nr:MULTISPECIES: membrane protein insertase YidC [Holospora]ETZ05434.1 membrane protein insertase YidC [Holospora undulata HU1]GAJ46381.1 membrane protein insertase YidC [Holospora elegans E1]
MGEYKNILVAFGACIFVWVGYELFLKPKFDLPSQNLVRESVPKNNSKAPVTCFVSEDQSLESKHVTLSNKVVKAKIRLQGAILDDLALTDYKEHTSGGAPVRVLRPYGTRCAYWVSMGWEPKDRESKKSNNFFPSNTTVWRVAEESSEKEIVLKWCNSEGVEFEQKFSFDQKYMLKVVQTVKNTTNEPFFVQCRKDIFRQGPVENADHWLSYEGPVAVCDRVLSNISYGDLEKGSREFKKGNWAGISDKYWLVALIGDSGAQALEGEARKNLKDMYNVSLKQKVVSVLPQKTYAQVQSIFLGPKEVKILDYYGHTHKIQRFDLAVDFGWFYFITKPVFYILSFFKTCFGSFAAAILLLTVCVRGLFFPLAVKSARSMAAMQRLQPKLVLLKEKFKDDKMALNQGIMELYRAQKINPFSSIWPMLLQCPLFFALYKVLFVSIEMRHAPFWGWIQDLSSPDPTSVLTLFGMIPIELPASFAVGVWPLLMGVTMIIQQRASSAQNISLDRSQQWVLSYGLPALFVYMMAQFPVGMIIYWTWNNILTIAQQYSIRYFNLVGNHV